MSLQEVWADLSRGWKATLITSLIVLFVIFGGQVPW